MLLGYKSAHNFLEKKIRFYKAPGFPKDPAINDTNNIF